MGHLLDVEQVSDDIELFQQRPPVPDLQDGGSEHGSVYVIALHVALSRALAHYSEQPGGRRAKTCIERLPTIITAINTPKAFIREFLGGYFGGDGGAPCLEILRQPVEPDGSVDHTKEKARFKCITFCIQCAAENVAATKSALEELAVVLQRFAIRTRIPPAEPRPNNKVQWRLEIDTRDIHIFSEQIGFRYNCHKQMRLTAAATYCRARARVLADVQECQRRFKAALAAQLNASGKFPYGQGATILKAAVDEALRFDVLDQQYLPLTLAGSLTGYKKFIECQYDGSLFNSNFDNVSQYLVSINARRFFHTYKKVHKRPFDSTTNSTDINADRQRHHYAVPRSRTSLPTFNLRVLRVKQVMQQVQTYDISVPGARNFLANGIVVHNCASMDKFRMEMCAQVERGDLEDLLLQTADQYIDQKWTCTICRADNKIDALMCISCTACKLHGEQECKACRNAIQAQAAQQRTSTSTR